MPRPARDALRQTILEVAQHSFSTVGFGATSLQMIADGAECSKASLLYHFHSKSAILSALSEGLVDDIEQVRADLAACSDEERPRATLRHCVAVVVRHREAIAMLRGLDEVDELRDLAERGEKWADEMRDGIVGHEPTRHDRVAAMVFVHGLVGACMTLPELTDDELTDSLLDLGERIFGLSPATH